MKGEERRKQLLNILSSSNNPISGGTLSKELNVSRQIIVQDISLLRANGATIFSTNKGYLLQEDRKYSRVFKVYHTDDQVEEELSTIVDAGGQIRDVFVYHKVYGVLKADMGIKSRRDIRAYMEEISTGKSSLLKNVTSGYHYHTIDAESEEILDAIHRPLGARSLDSVKRRTRAGMGRCQAGFCSPRTMEILSRELSMDMEEITKCGGDSKIVVGTNKDRI